MTNYKLLNNTLQDKKPPTPFLMRNNTSVEKGKKALNCHHNNILEDTND